MVSYCRLLSEHQKESDTAARVIPLLGSLMQGVSAILFGTVLSIIGLSLAVRYARNRTVAFVGSNLGQLRWLILGLKIVGGVALIFL